MNMKKLVALACMALAFITAGTSMADDNTGSGGTITYTDSNGSNAVASPPYIGGYVVHTFTNSGTLNIPVPASANVLVVAGGGGGGGSTGGGGGAGGYIYSNAFPVVGGSNYTVTVGAGRPGGSGYAQGTSGDSSVFGILTAVGGGGGGANQEAVKNGKLGGSGGGASWGTSAAGTFGAKTSGQGSDGGYPLDWGTGGFYTTGGGGGAFAAGVNGISQSGGAAGGAGVTNSISGTATVYAGGGGGGVYQLTGNNGGGLGGSGIGGRGGCGPTSQTQPTSGAVNTGSGGGGQGGNGAAVAGSGGSGIVIVRYSYDAGSLNVSVTAPANGRQFLPGSSVTATVSVASGTMPYTVEFYTNGVSAWSDSASTNLFTIDLGTLADGTYTNYATVTDSATPTAATAFSVTNTFTVAPDTTPPTPNPMTFAVAPKGLTVTSVVMTASTATDTLSSPVYYFFENTTNSSNSDWITSTVWTNTGLTLGTTYGYRVKARDSATPTPNETDWSDTLTAPAFGGEYFVATNGSDTVNNGMSWASPFLTISNAVAKSDALIVTVSNGTYNITDQIVVGKALTVRSFGGGVYGGLANATNTVVNRGGGGSRVFNLSVAGVVLDGLTIRGSGSVYGGYAGGGVYMPNGGTVQNCMIRNNWAAGEYLGGGGVYMVGGTLSNCIVQANTVEARAAGGGINANNSQIVNCQVIGNRVDGDGNNAPAVGGGIYAQGSTLVRNCLIVSNVQSVAQWTGVNAGGVYGGRIENCTIVRNSAQHTAGGVYGSVVTNSIVLDNTTVTGGGMNYGGSSTFAYSYSLPQPSGVGNINSAFFVDAAAGNYRLMPCPAVDGGTNLTWMAGALDLDGNPRTNGVNNRVDMGAYERAPGALQCGLAADVLSVLSPSNVVFTAFLDGTNKNITSYNWDFGDGQTASGATLAVVTNTYTVPGSYTVTLTVANDAGESAAATNSNYIAVWGTYAYVAAASPSPTAPYHTWANAARTIADAVAAAPAGVTVVLTNATYAIPLEIIVQKARTITSFGGGVYGGLTNAANTVVNRGGGSRVFNLSVAGVVLDGLTIRGGVAGGAGGGVYMPNGGTVQNCIVRNNQGSGENLGGGGVYMVGGALSNCIVQANTVDSRAPGGGINANNSQIINCQVIGNINNSGMNNSPIAGCGIYAQGSTLIRNCLIASNVQSIGAWNGVNAGGVYGGRIENCTIVGNRAPATAGGVYGSVVTNSIVWNNTTVSGTGTNYGGSCTFAYSCTAPLPAGTGNMMSDPLFVNAAAGDYRLASEPPASPCNDKGTNLGWMTGAVDLGGNLRIQHNIVDMGAYESVFIPAGTVILFF
jgi:hypothetical protein